MYKVGVSSLGFSLTEANFQALQKADIHAIEISMSDAGYPHICYSDLAAFSKRYQVDLWSYHLPFTPFTEIDISALDSQMRNHTTDYLSELIKKGADIGIDKFIIHPSGEPVSDEERTDRLKYAMQSLDLLAEIAAQNGACIAVEDLPRTCLGNSSEEIAQLISANDKLRVCFDTNHLLTDDNLHFMDVLSDKIITVHVSDYDFINERHWLPGEGKIDWNALLKKFQEIQYNGVWMYEIPLKCPNTIIRDRDLQFKDFAKNAAELFTQSSLTVLGEAKKNLGMWN